MSQYSVKNMAATLGQKLLDLRYVDTSAVSSQWMTSRQRVLYALLTIGAVWMESRLDDFIALTRHISAVAHVCVKYQLILHTLLPFTAHISSNEMYIPHV